MPITFIPADRARLVHRELHRVLSESWHSGHGRTPTLYEVIAELHADLREQAVCLLSICSLSFDDEASSARLLFALASLFSFPAPSDDDEARFAAIIASPGHGKGAADRAIGDSDARLLAIIAESWREETELKLTPAIRKRIERAHHP